MKNNRKKYVVGTTMLMIISTILVVALLPGVSSIEIPIGEIQYLENDIIPRMGNISLMFNHSDDNRPSTDLVISTSYDNVSNVTVITFTSVIITPVDYNFTNNTKSYYYVDENDNTSIYVIKINFSSIPVPANPYEEIISGLEAQLSEKDIIISQKDANISFLSANKSGIWTSLNVSNTMKDLYLTERDNAVWWNSSKDGEIVFLYSENENITSNYTILQNAYGNKSTMLNTEEWLKSEAYKTIDQLQDPMGLGYSWYEQQGTGEYLKQDGTKFSIVWLLIGIFIVLIPFTYFFIIKPSVNEDDDYADDDENRTVVKFLKGLFVTLAYKKPRKERAPPTIDESMTTKVKEKFLVPEKKKERVVPVVNVVPEFTPIPKEEKVEVKPKDYYYDTRNKVDEMLRKSVERKVDNI